MVDVGDKQPTLRRALARARVAFPPGVLRRILADGGPKGPITEVARTAGILAAKRTADLIPLCHPLHLDHVDLTFVERGDDILEVRCQARCTGRTGVEMEALTGAAVGALTIYDMVKGLDKAVRLESIELLEKSGGRSGDWSRPGWQDSDPPQPAGPHADADG